jgi:hypothetical protein
MLDPFQPMTLVDQKLADLDKAILAHCSMRKQKAFRDLIDDALLLRGKVWGVGRLCSEDSQLERRLRRLERELDRFEGSCRWFVR